MPERSLGGTKSNPIGLLKVEWRKKRKTQPQAPNARKLSRINRVELMAGPVFLRKRKILNECRKRNDDALLLKRKIQSRALEIAYKEWKSAAVHTPAVYTRYRRKVISVGCRRGEKSGERKSNSTH